jgi:hypothetical protein
MANQLVATVLVESASQRPWAVNGAGMEGSSPDRMSKPGSPSVRLSVANAHVGSGATGVCASPTLGRLTVQLDCRCNGWNRWPKIALARSPAAKTLCHLYERSLVFESLCWSCRGCNCRCGAALGRRFSVCRQSPLGDRDALRHRRCAADHVRLRRLRPGLGGPASGRTPFPTPGQGQSSQGRS